MPSSTIKKLTEEWKVYAPGFVGANSTGGYGFLDHEFFKVQRLQLLLDPVFLKVWRLKHVDAAAATAGANHLAQQQCCCQQPSRGCIALKAVEPR